MSYYNKVTYVSGARIGDTLTTTFPLQRGLYNATFYLNRDVDLGITDWYLNNVRVVTDLDSYNSSASTSGITYKIPVSKDGMQVMKGVITGKNVSSSNYYVEIEAIQFVAEADPDAFWY